MKIKKGTKLEIDHYRKGKFKAVANEDFNTEDKFWKLTVLTYVNGKSTDWVPGESIPCSSDNVRKYKIYE